MLYPIELWVRPKAKEDKKYRGPLQEILPVSQDRHNDAPRGMMAGFDFPW